MRHAAPLALIALLAGGACSHDATLGSPPTPMEVRQFNDRAAGRTAVATLLSGDSVALRDSHVDRGRLLTRDDPDWTPIPLEAIEAIRVRSTAKGVGDGIMIGLAAGGVAGLFAALTDLCTDCDRVPYVATLAVGSAALGAIPGGLFGALIGARYQYRVTPPPEPAAPPEP